MGFPAFNIRLATELFAARSAKSRFDAVSNVHRFHVRIRHAVIYKNPLITLMYRAPTIFCMRWDETNPWQDDSAAARRQLSRSQAEFILSLTLDLETFFFTAPHNNKFP